jgi:hypothetical protein
MILLTRSRVITWVTIMDSTKDNSLRFIQKKIQHLLDFQRKNRPLLFVHRYSTCMKVGSDGVNMSISTIVIGVWGWIDDIVQVNSMANTLSISNEWAIVTRCRIEKQWNMLVIREHLAVLVFLVLISLGLDGMKFLNRINGFGRIVHLILSPKCSLGRMIFLYRQCLSCQCKMKLWAIPSSCHHLIGQSWCTIEVQKSQEKPS